MDPDKAVMKNSQGVLAAVPYWNRTQKMGFPPGADRKKKKNSDSVERGPALESSATEEELTFEKMQKRLYQQISELMDLMK